MKKMLLADDSMAIQRVVKLTFEEEDYDVISVGNGDRAVEVFEQIRPDVVLADVFMPGRNGFSVCEYIKSHPTLHHTPVVLLVGTFEPFDQAEARRVRSSGFLTKPFEAGQLIQLVHGLVEKASREVSGKEAPEPPGRAEEPVAKSDAAQASSAPEPEAAQAVAQFASDWDRPEDMVITEDDDHILELFDEDLSFPEPVSVVQTDTPPVPKADLAAAAVRDATPIEDAAVPGDVLSDADIDRIVERVVKRLSDDVVREVAWEVVPDMAEILIKERLKSQQQPH